MKIKATPLRISFAGREFPKIYRFFTDLPFKRALRTQFLVIAFSTLLVLILTLGFDLLYNLQKQKEQSFQRNILTSELKAWESIAQKFPNFKDAYFELAVLSYRLGYFRKAREYIKKALFLDPNFERAKELQKKLY